MWQIGEIGNVDCLWIANLECHRLIKLLLRHLYKVGGWLLTCDLILHWHMDQMPICISSTMGACQSMYAVLMFGKCNLPIWSLFDLVNEFAQIRQAFYSKVDFFCNKLDNKFSFWWLCLQQVFRRQILLVQNSHFHIPGQWQPLALWLQMWVCCYAFKYIYADSGRFGRGLTKGYLVMDGCDRRWIGNRLKRCIYRIFKAVIVNVHKLE